MKDSSRKQFSFSPWPLGIILFFMLLAGVNFYLFWIANQAPHQLVVEDYYANAMDYDQIIEAQIETEKRGWQVGLVHQKKENRSYLRITLKNAEQHLILEQSGTLDLYRPSDQSKDIQAALTEIAPGVYQTELSALDSGLWEVRVSFRGEDQKPLFYKKIRLHI